MSILKYRIPQYPGLAYPGQLLRFITLILSLCACLVSIPAQAQDLAQDDGYTLNAGDSIRIHVYGEEDLTFQQLLIGHNGRISYPFLGELKVSGKTAAQLQQMLIDGLKPDYLVDPRISVSIVKYRPFFVNGEVKRPGGVAFQPGLTLRKAISLAGGFTERANKKEVRVITDTNPDLGEQKVGLDYRVQPGDIFTVRDTFF
jgi:protein involved in polysaccharide export with SLBB domain